MSAYSHKTICDLHYSAHPTASSVTCFHIWHWPRGQFSLLFASLEQAAGNQCLLNAWTEHLAPFYGSWQEFGCYWTFHEKKIPNSSTLCVYCVTGQGLGIQVTALANRTSINKGTHGHGMKNWSLEPSLTFPSSQQHAGTPADGKQTQTLSGALHLPQQVLITLKAEQHFRHLRCRVSAPSSAIHPTEGITRTMNAKLGFNSTALMQTPLAWRHREEPCPPPPTHSSSAVCQNFILVKHNDSFPSFVKNKVTQLYTASRNLFSS